MADQKPVRNYANILKFPEVRVNLGEQLEAGDLIRFSYGQRSVDKPGGWKNDQRPIVLVLYDDQKESIEGINLNYLEISEMRQLFSILSKYAGTTDQDNSGIGLYENIKSSGLEFLRKSYRKYKRKSITMAFKYDTDLVGVALYDEEA